MSSIFFKMLGALLFQQPCLYMPPHLQSPSIILSPTSSIIHLPISPLLVHKIILRIPTNTPFLDNSLFFYFSSFAYSQPYNLHQKYFPNLSHLVNSGCVIELVSKGAL